MNILIIGAVFAVLLLFVPKWLERSKAAMLAQYEILEKRFRLKRKTYPSKWGKGIAERHSLSGEFRGYPISLYDHFRGGGKDKEIWTSLTLEMLFAGELEIVLEPHEGDAAARFPTGDSLSLVECELIGYSLYSDSELLAKKLFDLPTCERVSDIEAVGSFRLSKGFFEYRESGLMLDETMRIRFQEALRLLADLGDRLAELTEKT